jgi:hypothetical protein
LVKPIDEEHLKRTILKELQKRAEKKD